MVVMGKLSGIAMTLPHSIFSNAQRKPFLVYPQKPSSGLYDVLYSKCVLDKVFLASKERQGRNTQPVILSSIDAQNYAIK